jgi:hypothetical protein
MSLLLNFWKKNNGKMKRITLHKLSFLIFVFSFCTSIASDQVSNTPNWLALPKDIWKEVIPWVASQGWDIFSSYGNNDFRKLMIDKMIHIKGVKDLALTCRLLHELTQEYANEQLKDIQDDLNKVKGGAQTLLFNAVAQKMVGDALGNICLKFGANINAPIYKVDKCSFEYQPGGNETLLTWGLKNKDYSHFVPQRVLDFGADTLCPNALGELPLEVAEQYNRWEFVPTLKEACEKAHLKRIQNLRLKPNQSQVHFKVPKPAKKIKPQPFLSFLFDDNWMRYLAIGLVYVLLRSSINGRRIRIMMIFLI